MERNRSLTRTILHAWLCFFIAINALAQQQLGLNPPSMKWSQINTPTGRIIFPKGLDSIAFHTAALMDYERNHDESIAGTGRTKRVPVILQNQSTLPAGFSTPAPWRNEYYLTPPQNVFLGPVQWMDAMVLHEYRHTQQFYMATQGFGWVYRILMGQTGWLFNSLMTQPLWFREGDAVVGETLFTQGGRGRLPSFHMEYRAMRMAGYHYDYEKAHYSSFKDFVPNPYRIGYYMVTKARKEFGEDIWTKVLSDTYHRKGFIYPFSRSLRKYTGMGTKTFYNETVKDLDSLWKVTDKAVSQTPSEEMTNARSHKYTSYRFPHYLKDRRVLVLKSGLDLINTYYIIENAKERKLFCPGIYTEDHVTTVVEGDLMTWAESGFHERWINKDYSIIKSYNFATGKVSKLTSKTRYFSPAPSKDGRRIIVSETDMRSRYTLILLDALTGNELKRLPNPQNHFFTHMRWQDDRFVVAVMLDHKGNTLVRIDTETGDVQKLLEETRVPLSRPFPAGDLIFFSAGSEGVNNIYALTIADGEIHQVTRSRFGAFEPVVSADGSTMLYSDYTADGYRVKEIELHPSAWQKVTLRQPGDIVFHLPLLSQEEMHPGTLASTPYPVRKYHALTSGLFNFYGWIPLPNIPEYGLEVYTRNLMSTLTGTVGYAYNTNEDRGRYYARLTYAALYPYIELNLNKGLRRSANVLPESDANGFFEQEWRENSVSAGLRLPFRLTQGTHETHLELAGFYEYYDVSSLDSADVSIQTTSTNFDGFHGEFLFRRLRTQARQHVKPRWGQQVDVNYQKAFSAQPERLSGSSILYFPGLFRTHSLNFHLAYKREEVMNSWRYTDDFIMPRGYEPMPYREISMASVNYELPVWYPDISAGSVAFFQRLRTNFFVDYAKGQTGDFTQPMTSAGGELFIDLRFFRLFQTTLAFRFNAPFDDPVAGTIPFQFLITRFELAN
jgi:hypothetical protein